MRAIEVLALHCQSLLAGVDPDLHGGVSVLVSEADIAELSTLADSVVEAGEQARGLFAGVPQGVDVEVRHDDLEREAAKALALGVGDIERIEVLARCLSVRAGFRALAEALRCTDSHESWGSATIGDVLGRFRGSDEHFVRRLTLQAHLSPATTFAECDRSQLARLAGLLEDHSATDRCR